MQAEVAKLENRPIASLRPYAGNARTHSKKQVKQIADSITQFGFTNPVLISDDGEIIAGHGRVSAAKLLGHQTVPTLRLSHLSATERRAYVLADNKLALNAGWDQDILAIELQSLIDLEFDLSVTGFSLAEVDFTLDAARERAPDTPAAADILPPMIGPIVTRSGDLWQLGRHRLICGDARNEGDYAHLLAGETVDLIFTIHRTTCRSTVMSAVQGASVIASLPWVWARCRRPPSQASLPRRSGQRGAAAGTVPSPSCAWIGGISVS